MNRTSISKKPVVCSLQSAVSLPKSSVFGLRSSVFSGRRQAAGGFTLIELMIVVLVILMLSGMLLRIGGIAGDKSSRAKATSDIQNIQHALNEYMAEYGTYPPVQSTAYVFENANLQSDVFRRAKKNEDDPLSDFELLGGNPYGLVSHLYERDRGNQEVPYDEDTERDKAAKKRWAHYLKDVAMSSGQQSKTNTDYGSTQYYTNSTLTIVDPWSREYKYRSPPPYLSYRLWSAGPDGQNDTADDITN